MNNMTRTVITTSATGEPVTLPEMKAHLRLSTDVGYTAEDSYIGDLVSLARQFAEDVTWRKFMPQTVTMYLDQFPSTGEIRLPYGNLSSSTGVQISYTNSTGATANLSTGNFKIDSASNQGRVVLNSSGAWPTDQLSPTNPVAITFKCGYGATSTSTGSTAITSKVPVSIKHAIKIVGANFYENREPVVVGAKAMGQVPLSANSLLANYSLKSF